VRAVSPIAVIGLGARQGDTLWILATGPDADDAVHALQMLIEQGFGEEVAQTTGEINLALAAHRGVGLSPGRVVGQVLHALSDLEAPKSADPLPEDAREADAQRIPRAAYHVAADLRERAAEARDAASRQVLEATAVLAEDRMLHEDAMSRVRLLGETAERAVWEMLSAIALQYERQGDVLAERASDVRDLRSRIVAQLQDTEVTTVPITTLPHILVANDIPPVDAAGLDPRICLGLVLGQGGPTSHSTIIARSLGIPVVIHPQAVATVQNDVTILIDGSTGELLSKPGEAEIATARTTPLILADLEPVHDPVLLTDGHRVPLLGNIGGIEDAKRARERGAVGVGLFRTEYLFLQDAEAPDTEEQTRAYAEVLEEFQGQKVIFRTLDVGSDKPLPFLPRPEETNSALGVRGIRTAQPNPELLETQLHAIAAAAHDNPNVEVGVMAPMVTTWKESQDFAALARRCGIDSVGIMVETPAAAVMAQELSEPLSFLSIGTNDLTQYTLAADRLSTQLASLNTPWQPSVLRLIAQTVTGAGDLSVSVCGEAASDPLLAVALIGLGVSELSMTPSVLPVVANALGQVSLDQCRRAALAAQSALSAAAARESVASIVQSA
jgi:phosphoenolpyruvate-protein phosphotransferase